MGLGSGSVGHGGQGPNLGKIGTERKTPSGPQAQIGLMINGRKASMPQTPRRNNTHVKHGNPLAARQAHIALGAGRGPLKKAKGKKTEKEEKKEKVKKSKGKSLGPIQAIGEVTERLKNKKDPREKLLDQLSQLKDRNQKFELKTGQLEKFIDGLSTLFTGINPKDPQAGKLVHQNVVRLITNNFESSHFIKADYNDFYGFLDDLLSLEEFEDINQDESLELLSKGEEHHQKEVLSEITRIEGREVDADTEKSSQDLQKTAEETSELSEAMQVTFNTLCELAKCKVRKGDFKTEQKALRSVYKDLLAKLGTQARTIVEGDDGSISVAPGKAGRDAASRAEIRQAAEDTTATIEAANEELQRQLEQKKRDKRSG